MRKFVSILVLFQLGRAFPDMAKAFTPSLSRSEMKVTSQGRSISCRIQAAPISKVDARAGGEVVGGRSSTDQITLTSFGTARGRDIMDYRGWVYFTNITLGSPPQTFRAAIDIGYSDVFVPSVTCVRDPNCLRHPQYNSSQSSTYTPNRTSVHVYYSGFYTSGYASSDILGIGDLMIADQTFEEATQLKPTYVFPWKDAFDSALGLPRFEFYPETQTSLRATSPFHNMIRQSLLKKNMFSLRLSRDDTEGELLLGDLNPEQFVEPLHTFPVTTNLSSEYPANYVLLPGWQIAAHTIAFHRTETTLASFDLTGHVAAFSTWIPFIGLHHDVAESLYNILNTTFLGQMDCARRRDAPDMYIYLGNKGVPFVLRPQDYIREQPNYFRTNLCQLEVATFDVPEDGTEFILLGSVFLNNYYSVFNWDEATISLANLK